MAKYHINPETGVPNICRANVACAFAKNGNFPKHYDSRKEAEIAFEKQNIERTVQTLNKKKDLLAKREENKQREIKQKQSNIYIEQLRKSKDQREQCFTAIEELSIKEEALKNNPKKVQEYLYNLEFQTYHAEKLEDFTSAIKSSKLIRDNPEEKEKYNALLDDAKAFKQEIMQKEFSEILRLRYELKKQNSNILRRTFANSSVGMNSLLIGDIHGRMNKIYEMYLRSSYKERADWKEFISAQGHLFEENERYY